MFRITAISLLITMLVAALGCGGGPNSTSQTPTHTAPPLTSPSVVVTPGNATVYQGATARFQAQVAGQTSQALVWSVSEGAVGGVVDQTGLYTAPQTAGTFHVSATLQSDSTNSGIAVVTVPEFVSISPAAETLGPKGMRQFVANVTDKNQAVTWGIEEGAPGGTITSSGLYTVPDHVGTFHVVATSVANPLKSATARVNVVASGFGGTVGIATARVGHTATLLSNGKVLVAGGDDATAELFDPASESFTRTGNMTTRRYGATATLLGNGKVLIVGGYGPCSTECPLMSTAELYDPLTGTFSATGSMSQARASHTATLLATGKVLITGGGGFAALASAELYDPATGGFTSVGSMITDREEHTATLLATGEVLIAGGWNGHAADSPDDPPWDPLFAELFDPSSGILGLSGTMSTTRISHTATRLLNGKVLMFGGIPNPQNIHDQPPAPANAELYDPVSRTFASAGNTEISRQGHTATLLANGTVLIAGGQQQAPSTLVLGSAELYDPASGSFTATGGLVAGRWGHTATLLNDGRVLVVGGRDGTGAALATAEIYE